MKASREFSRTPRRLPPCSDVSVLQKTRMSHSWDPPHTTPPDYPIILLSLRQKVERPGLRKRRFSAFDWPRHRSA